jgi:hypothetical protein
MINCRGILIHTAIVGYAKQPDFDLNPPKVEHRHGSVPTYVFTPTMEQRIAYAICNSPSFRKAYEEEGIKINWNLLEKTARTTEKRWGRSKL